MRATKRPNWWAAGVLVFCLGAWGVSVVAVAKTAHIYTHRSRSGFRHDLVARTRVHLQELEHVVVSAPQPVNGPEAEHT